MALPLSLLMLSLSLILCFRRQVKSEGVAVSHLEPGGFVGSMAFNRFMKKTASTSRDGHYVYKEGGMFRKAWEGILHQLRREGSVVGEVAQTVVGDGKLKRRDALEMERATSTVTATSDVSMPPKRGGKDRSHVLPLKSCFWLCRGMMILRLSATVAPFRFAPV